MKDKEKHIAVIIPGGIGTGKNNIGVPVLEQIVRLLAREYYVTVFQLYKVNDGYKPIGFELVEVYSKNPLIKYLRLIFAFGNAHHKKNFKVVHGFWALPNGLFAVAFGKIFGIKSVVSILGGDAISLPEINYGQLQKASYKKLIFWTLRHADHVNALTDYLIHNLRKAGFERKDFQIIPWGIDTTLFDYRNEPLRQPIEFLHIGNLHPVKDQATLLRAFREIRNRIPAKLLIIGEGVSEANIRALIEDLNLQQDVGIKGLVPYTELRKFYGNADVLLHTSVSEGQSEVVTEAMCSGLLVCGTRVGLLHDLPDCCVSVDVGDYISLANEVMRIIADTRRIFATRARAHNWSQEHSILWTVARYKISYFG